MALPDDVQKDVLRQVLRFCAIAENPSPNPVHQADVTAEKHPECFPIALANIGQQGLVRQPGATR
jgi:hypothetical protein